MRRAIMCLVVLAGAAAAPGQGPIANPPPAARNAADQPALTRPAGKSPDCTTSGCHADQMSHAFLHGPAAVKACESCHEYADPAKHTFVLKRQGQELCSFCHIGHTGQEGPVVHAPVADGDCLACHDPHGGTNRLLLRADSVADMCQQCHTGVTAAQHVHGPAATDCTSCHKAHTATHKGLLMMESRALCLSCHEELGQRIAGARHPHDPATGDCLQCHSPHASDHAGVLKAAPKDLCLECHADVGKSVDGARHPHSAVTDSRSCLNCHAPHDSQHVHLLAAEPVETCLQCHAKPIKTEQRTVAAVAELASANMHRHGPIREGHCSGCHEVHGGAGPQLLLHEYPQGFYQKFSEGSYALCFSCHDRSLVLTEKTTSATRFRDGDRNLHHVHVTKGQGRSCRSCHAVHASASEELIAETVAFGQWKLPINFKSTPEGGSCAPGCHKVENYDRTVAATRGLTPPASTAPAPAPATRAPNPLPPPR